MKTVAIILAAVVTLLAPAAAWCGEADVVDVQVARTANGTYLFSVTVQHTDAGWNHYADKWEILAPDGTLLGTRVLHHPHVHEQPFTRSLSGIKIAAGMSRVTIRAHDSVHGWGGKTMTVSVPHGV